MRATISSSRFANSYSYGNLKANPADLVGERAEAERAASERARREREAADARGQELDALARREAEAWAEVESHVATKQPKRYDLAAKLLRDLRDLGLRRGDARAVEARIERLCADHELKSSFVRRVRAALRPTTREP